ncbi:carbohydrate-binding protein, partial [Cupriavidus sp. Marseille-Q8015]
MSSIRSSLLLIPAAMVLHAGAGYAQQAWQEGATYASGTTVTYNGRQYQALQTHTAFVGAGWNPAASPTLWKDLGPA